MATMASDLGMPETPMDTGPPRLHRGSWLVPVSRPPIENGALLVARGTILDMGPYREVKSRAPSFTEILDHGNAAILPGLVNAHTHLELSYLRDFLALPAESFRKWLMRLLEIRGLLTPERLAEGVHEGCKALFAAGCLSCGDITNGGTAAENDPDRFSSRHVFLELLGFDRNSLHSSLEPGNLRLISEEAFRPSSFSLAGHSCYASSAELLLEAKAWTRSAGLPFSVHVAEHEHEIEFLRQGTGFCRELLEDLGRWVPSWNPPRMTPVEFLEHLGVLDSLTILVHAVHLTRRDWEIVRSRRCSVCFCPRSNQNLRVGLPEIQNALDLGIPAALATDGLTSNSDLNLFQEAAFVLDHYPQVPPGAVISMITQGGARALAQDNVYGSLEPGSKAPVLIVSLSDAFSDTELMEVVIHQGSKGAWRWSHLILDR